MTDPNDHSLPTADAETPAAPKPVSARRPSPDEQPGIVPTGEDSESGVVRRRADDVAAQAAQPTPVSARLKAEEKLDVLPKDAAPGALTKRQRRGAFIAGAISLPLVSVGLITLGVPLGLWYLSTVFRSIAVVIGNMVGGRAAANDANDLVQQVNVSALSQASVALTIAGAIVVVAGILVSLFVLRSHQVARPWGVTIVALPMGLTISTITSLVIGSLSGFLFRDTQTVAGILANSALGAVGTVFATLVVTVAVGFIVWHWMARLYRATVHDEIGR